MSVRARPLLTVAVTVAMLALLAWRVDPREVLRAAAALDPLRFALVAALFLLFNTVQSAEVYRWGLRALGCPLPYRACLAATAGGIAIRAVLPAGVGAMARAAYVHRVHGAGLAQATGAAVLVLGIKLIWLQGAALLGWALLPDRAAWHGAALGVVLAGSLFALALAPRLCGALEGRLGGGKLGRVTDALARALTRLRPAALVPAALHSGVSVNVELVLYGLILDGLGGNAKPVLVLAFFPLCVIGAKLPLTVMGLGTRDALAMLLLRGAADRPTLLASTLLFLAADQLIPALLGAALTWGYVARMVRGTARPGPEEKQPAEGPSDPA